ncbi:MAG: hypothetical protein U0Q11_27410 [Vicinamibacterales bacterium]
MCARLRVCELAEQQQVADGFRLNIDLVGQQIGGAQVLATGVLEVSGLHVDVSELLARLAELRILLNRVAVLDDRLAVFLVGHVLIAALHERALGGLWVGRASTRDERREQQRRQEVDTHSGGH